MVSSDRAKPSPHRSLYQFTQLFSRSSRNGKRHAGTTSPMTGFLQADGTVAGNNLGTSNLAQICTSCGAVCRNSKAIRMAHVPAHLLDSPAKCRDRVQSNAGAVAAFL